MPVTLCHMCMAIHTWSWEEAFDKFGFNDGDGLVMTHRVVQVLRDASYRVTSQRWGCHNVVITSIRKGRRQLIPDTANVGYHDPREYLPAEVVKLLDTANMEVQP